MVRRDGDPPASTLLLGYDSEPIRDGGRGGRGGGGGGDAGAQPLDKSFTIYAGAANAAVAVVRPRRTRWRAAGRRAEPKERRRAQSSLARRRAPSRSRSIRRASTACSSSTSARARTTAASSRAPVAAAERRRSGSEGGGGGGRGGRGSFLPPKGTAAVQLFIQRGSGERKAITSAAYTHVAPSVSPDGKWVVFAADAALRPDSVVAAERDRFAKMPRDRKRDEADRNDTDLFILPVADCEAGNAATCKPKKIEYFGNESNIIWAPDGKRFAFVGRPGQYGSSRLLLASVDGGKAVDLLGTWQYEPGQIEWFKDGKIRMQATTGGSSGLYAVDPDSKQMTTILGGRRQVGGIMMDKAQSKLVYTSSDISHLAEYYVSDINGQNEKKLTTFNDALQKEVAFSDAERALREVGRRLRDRNVVDEAVRLSGRQEVSGGALHPRRSALGVRRRLVRRIPEPRRAGRVRAVLESARLERHERRVHEREPRRLGRKDYMDLMKVTDWAAARADVDSTKMGVTGGSYGGFMTAWITGHTTRFKAAQTDRMISDWTYWWGASDAQGLTNNEFFGKPWENQAMYDSLSPIRFVKNVKTPTLMVQSEED